MVSYLIRDFLGWCELKIKLEVRTRIINIMIVCYLRKCLTYQDHIILPIKLIVSSPEVSGTDSSCWIPLVLSE